MSGFGTVGRLPASFLTDCGGSIAIPDETIALAAIIGYSVPSDKQGDTIFIDGIRLLYKIAQTSVGSFTLTPADLDSRGTFDPNYLLPSIIIEW